MIARCFAARLLMQKECSNCGRILKKDEIGIYKKLINRGAETFMCATCLAAFFKVDETFIYRKIEEFRKMGCTLFTDDKQ